MKSAIITAIIIMIVFLIILYWNRGDGTGGATPLSKTP